MKWLKKLLSFGSEEKTPLQTQNVQKIGRRMVRIQSLDMFGPYTESPNGLYLLVLQDSDGESGVGGYRHSGNGKFALVKEEQVLFVGECERPTEGEVANNGMFAICDTLFGDKLRSRLYIYSPNGNSCFSHTFLANTLNIGISNNGQYGAVQLCNSDNAESSKLNIIDIGRAEIICSFIPHTGWAERYEFSTTEGIIFLCYKNNRRYRYSFDGKFLDSDSYDKESVEDASPTELVLIVKEKLKSTSDEKMPSLLALLDRAFKGNLSEYHDYNALAFRLKGEVHEAMNNHSEAIIAYKKAIEIDPKIGVKRKLQKLEKENQ